MLTDDEIYLLDSAFNGFLDDDLHRGFVYYRQHCLRNGFRKRKKASAVTRDRDNGLFDFLHYAPRAGKGSPRGFYSAGYPVRVQFFYAKIAFELRSIIV